MKQQVVSIQVGLPQSFGDQNATDTMNKVWTTGFFKQPVSGGLWLSRTNLSGDGQADLKNHGGPEKAVLAYASSNYPYWQETLTLPDLPHGAFGENFTVTGQSEASVCVGDIYTVGTAKIQVSQPRQPCWKLSRRWQIKDLAMQVQDTGFTGWYYRVLQEGMVEPGLQLVLCDRPYPQWTIKKANFVMHHDRKNRKMTVELAHCPLLSPSWQKTLLKRVKRDI